MKKGLDLLDKNKNFQYEIIEDVSKENLIKELPKFDGVTLRVASLDLKFYQIVKTQSNFQTWGRVR